MWLVRSSNRMGGQAIRSVHLRLRRLSFECHLNAWLLASSRKPCPVLWKTCCLGTSRASPWCKALVACRGLSSGWNDGNRCTNVWFRQLCRRGLRELPKVMSIHGSILLLVARSPAVTSLRRPWMIDDMVVVHTVCCRTTGFDVTQSWCDPNL